MAVAFDICFNRILKAEGGYTDNPLDTGGATKYGITLRALMAWRRIPQNKDDVKNLTEDDARRFYLETYWSPLRLDEVSNIGIALLLIDQAINRGSRPAVTTAQRVLKDARKLTGIVDGIIGDHTIAALNSVNFKEFGLAYVKTSQEEYVKICQNNPSQIVFLLGWLRRTHALLDQVVV